MAIHYTTEIEYNHELHTARPTGLHVTALIGHTEREYTHNHTFSFSNTNRINPSTNEATTAAHELITKMKAKGLTEVHFQNSKHWN